MRNLWLVWVWIAAIVLVNATAKAQTIDYNNPNDPYYQITDVVTESKGTALEPMTPVKIENARKSFQSQFLQTEQMSNIQLEDRTESVGPFGTATGIGGYAIAQLLFKLWDIILEGKPVVNVEVKNASALPEMANYHWAKLTGWRKERVVKYSIGVKNLLGTVPLSFDYAVKLMYGGSVAGRGIYIASARVVPSNVVVKWGYDLDVSVNVPNVVNVGREDDPNAQITLEVTYKIQSRIGRWTIKKRETTDIYKVQGDGAFWNQKTAEEYFQPIYHKPAPPLPSPSPTPVGEDPIPGDDNLDDVLIGTPTPSPTPGTAKPSVKPSPTPKKTTTVPKNIKPQAL